MNTKLKTGPQALYEIPSHLLVHFGSLVPLVRFPLYFQISGAAAFKFKKWLNSLRSNRSEPIYLIGHNLGGVDGPMFDSLFRHCQPPGNLRFFDTMRLVRRYNLGSYKYEELLERFDLPPQPGPYSDALRCARGLKKLVKAICRCQGISEDAFFARRKSRNNKVILE